MRFRVFTVLPFALVGVLVAGPERAPAHDPFAPIVFQEMSTLSGGPLAFPDLPSDTEKTVPAFVDTNGDGWDDLIVLTGQDYPTLYMLNVPDGEGGRTFADAPEGNGLTTGAPYERDGAAITAGDVDNDGDLDLFIGCGYNELLRDGSNILLLNDGDGSFTDVTAAMDLLDGNNTTCAAIFIDYDLDGDLDLYYANTSFAAAGKSGNGLDSFRKNLLMETGTLSFEEVIEETGIDERGQSVWAVSGLDYDNDGWPDLLITHDIQGPTQLFRNMGNGTFAEVTETVGTGQGDDGNPSSFGNDTPSAMGVDGGDIDNDGDLDFYITDTVANNLYRNNGNGTLTEISGRAGVRAGLVTWGCTFADFDLDGWIDLHVAGGDIYFLNRPEIRSWLYRNNQDGTFSEEFATSSLRYDPPLNREDGTAVADFDHDGRIDLLSARAYRAGASPYLYRNVTDVGDCRWISVELRGNGATSNRSAVGARIRVWPRDESGARIEDLTQLREVASQVGRCSVSSFRQVIGLGSETQTVDIQITWPRLGTIQSRRDLYLGIAIPEDGHIIIEDDLPQRLFPQEESFHQVASGAPFDLPLVGVDAPGAPPVAVIVSGPSWVSLSGGGATGWRLVGTSPITGAAVESYDVQLRFEDPGVQGAASDALVRIQVQIPPFVDEITVKGKGRRLFLVGGNFPLKGMTATVNGFPVKRVKVARKKDLQDDGFGTLANFRVPLKKAAARGGPNALVLTDSNRGAVSLTYEYTAP